MLTRCFLDCSVGVRVFVTGLSQISSFFSYRIKSHNWIQMFILSWTISILMRFLWKYFMRQKDTWSHPIWDLHMLYLLIPIPIPFRRLSCFFWLCTLQEKSSSRQSAFQWVRIVPLPSSRRHLSVFIRSGFRTIFALNGKETFSITVQSHLQVHRWCIVHKQPRIRKLSGPDVSCWTWDQRHHREHNFCFLPRFTTVDWEGWSTSHFHLRQTRWFQFPHHKFSVPG